MAVTQTIVYRNGADPEPGSAPAEAMRLAREAGGFAWVDLTAPAGDDVLVLGEELGLSRVGVLETLRAHERSKLRKFDGQLFLVLQPARYDDATETVSCHELDVFLADGLIVTITAAGDEVIAKTRAQLAAQPELLAGGPLAVAWALCEHVTRGYRDVLDGVENDIDEIEEELFGDDEGVSRRIFALQRDVIDLDHATLPLAEVLDRLREAAVQHGAVQHAATPDGAAQHAAQHAAKLGAAFQDTADRARYVEGRVTAFRHTLDNALTIHATLVDQRRNEQTARLTELGVRQNDQVKKISSWAAIGFAPTLVAGIYGMNFRFMPELDWTWGYPFALGLMVAVSAALYVVFKKNDWL